MKKKFGFSFFISFALVFFWKGSTAMAFTLASPAFRAEGPLPSVYTCEGADKSPPLAWDDVPPQTKAFALILDDPDARAGTWVHWVVYNIPGDARKLDEGLPKQETLPSGALQGLVWGVRDFGRMGYYGPCPPPGPAHRYVFKLHALDAPLKLPARATKAQVEAAMKVHILGQVQMIGKYGR